MSIDTLISDAEKKFKGNLFGCGKNYDEAAELYIQAGNQCLIQQDDRVTQLYQKAAECYVADNNIYRAIDIYFKMIPYMNDKIPIVDKIVTLAVSQGYWNSAAKATEMLASLYKEQFNNHQAIEAYQKAIQYHTYDNKKYSIRSCSQQLGLLYLESGNYEKCIHIYEELATDALSEKLSRYVHPGYVIIIVICHLANSDVIGAERYLEQAQTDNPGLNNTYEGRFIQNIVDSVKSYDVTKFTQTVYDYDCLKKLDNILCKVLLKIRSFIEGEESILI